MAQTDRTPSEAAKEKRPPKERPAVQEQRRERLERRKEAGREYNKERLQKLQALEKEPETEEPLTGTDLFNQLVEPYLEQYPNLVKFMPPFMSDEEYLAAQSPEWIQGAFARYLNAAQDRAEWAKLGKYRAGSTLGATGTLNIGVMPAEEAAAAFGQTFGEFDDETLAGLGTVLGNMLQARANRAAFQSDYFTQADMEGVE